MRSNTSKHAELFRSDLELASCTKNLMRNFAGMETAYPLCCLSLGIQHYLIIKLIEDIQFVIRALDPS